jgi:hypothetical protein
MQCYRNQLPNVALLPETVLTKWGTWIQAVNFYNKHFDVVKSVVATFHAESAVAVRESQTAFSEPKIACSMAYVRSNFAWIPDSNKKLETTGHFLQESIDILENEDTLSAVRGETGEKVYRKFQAVFKGIQVIPLLWLYAKSSTEKILTLLKTSLLENFMY